MKSLVFLLSMVTQQSNPPAQANVGFAGGFSDGGFCRQPGRPACVTGGELRVVTAALPSHELRNLHLMGLFLG